MRKRPPKKAPARTKKKTSTLPVEPQVPSPVTPGEPTTDGRLDKSLVRFGGAMATTPAEDEPVGEQFIKRKKLAMQLVALKIGGMELKEAAETLQIGYGYARNLISMAGKFGWWAPSEPVDRLENVIAHKAVTNVEEFLSHPHPGLRMDMTKEVMKGIGLFKTFTAGKDEGVQATTIIAIKIEHSGNVPTPDPALIEGKVGGTPGYVDGDVVE